MNGIESRILQSLQNRISLGTYRSLPMSNQLLDFTSNDYLGLAKSEILKKRSLESFMEKKLPLGATGSRLLSGNDEGIEETEKQIAAFHKAEAGLIFSSGYLANIGLFSSLPQRGDTVLYDSYCHASIKYGIRLSHAKSYAFKHNDLDDLQRKSQRCQGNVYVITESLFSMDGDLAPLHELAAFCKKNDFSLIVDEAHATGINGKMGEGIVCELGLEKDVFARVHTFGKALGLQGAVIVGPEILRRFLINFCHPFIYSTAMSPFLINSIRTAYNLLPELSNERRRIFTLHQQLKSGLRENSGLKFQGNGAVNCLIIPGNENARKAGSFLETRGCDVKPILSPTVPKGQERIRICLHAYNTDEELNLLVDAIKEFEESM